MFANSRDVAEHFGKRHDNVLRDIRGLDMSSKLRASMFEAVIIKDKYGRDLDAFDMTRDGFTLLAMGFTGAKALQFKLAYIAAFNEMEAKLKSSTPALPNFADPAAAAIAWGVQIFLEPPTSSNKTDRRITHMTCAPNFGGISIR